MSRLLILIFVIFPLSAYGSSAEREAQKVSIDVGKYNLCFNFISGSKPAIVFESGSGVEASHWNKIMQALASKLDNAIISYDRAGYGSSDLPQEPYNIENEVKGLKKGLDQLGYSDSLVYVGHSYAYYLLEMYGVKYSNSVKSLVFVDPVTIDFIDSMGGIEQELKNIDLSLLPDNDFGKALLRETKGLANTFAKVKNLRKKNRKNCFVISAEKPEWSSPKEVDEWQAGHQKLSNKCGSELIVAKGSHHDIPTHSPEIIVGKLVSILRNK